MNKNLFVTKKRNFDSTIWIPSCWMPDFKEEIMCDISNVDKLLVILVQKEIKKLTDEQKLFTSWNITKTLRDCVGPDYNIAHSDVREIVHDWWEKQNNGGFGGYCRTLVKMINDKISHVYHPLTTLAEKYPDFKELVDTADFSPKQKSCCQNNSADFDELYNAADEFTDVVQDFIDGEKTLNDVAEALDDLCEFLSEAKKD